MNKNKQLTINMIANVISFVVSLGISFFLTPYIIKNVGVEAYGFVGLSNNFISYATIFTTALNSMAGRFITISVHREEYEDVNHYFTSVIVANLFMAIPLTLAACFIVLNLEQLIQVPWDIIWDVKCLWALLFANFIINLIGNVFNVATFSQNRLELTSLRTIESNLLRVLVLMIAFWFFRPAVWYVGLASFICGIYVIVRNIYYTRRFLPYVRVKKNYFDFEKIKKLFFSGIWNSISQLSSILNTGLDLLITNIFVNASAMGMVSIAKTLSVQVRSLFYTLGSVFAPSITISYAKNNREEIVRQLIFSVRLLGVFACIPIAFIFVYSKEFFMLWTPMQNADLLQLLAIMEAFAMPLSLSMEPLYNIFTAVNKVKQSSIVLIAASLVSSILTFVLLHFAQDETVKLCIIVGTSTAIGILRVVLFVPIYGAKCLNVKWTTFYPVMGKVVVSSVITIFLSILVKNVLRIHTWFMLLVAVFITGIVAVIVNYFYMLNREERQMVKEKILKKVKKS